MKDNNSFDEYEMNNESYEKTLDYTYDIVLIEAIIDKKIIKIIFIIKILKNVLNI